MLARAVPWLLAATVGGLACLCGDHLHVTQGVLFYPHPVFWEQAWWVFPLFFFSTLLLVGGAPLVCPDEAPPYPHAVRECVGDAAALFTAYVFTAMAHALPWVVLYVLLGWWVARVIHGAPLRQALLCVVVAIGGTSWEAMWSGIGMFTYRDPQLFDVPCWLPALYLHAGFAAVSARRLLLQAPPLRSA